MYYVDHEQIKRRLDFIPSLKQGCAELTSAWSGKSGAGNATLLLSWAQERLLHLAIETVTDVGSLLIDAFMMRDASSYEDIVDVLFGEGVFDSETAAVLKELVTLRRALVQEYTDLPRDGLHELVAKLPGALERFAEAVPAFISKEMV